MLGSHQSWRIPRKGLTATIAAIAVVATGLGLTVLATGPDVYYDDNLDGSWVGWVRLATERGKRQFPVQLNLNAAGEVGVGTVYLPDDFTPVAPRAFATTAVEGLAVRGNKIGFSFDAGTAGNADAVLRYKPARDQITGKLAIDGTKSPVKLYRVDRATTVQRTWVGSWDGAPDALLVLGLPSTAGAARAASIKGTVFVGDDYGVFRGSLTDGRITGKVKLPGPDLTFDLEVGAAGVQGTADRGDGPAAVELTSLGSAPALRLVKVVPASVEAGVRTTVRIVGRDLPDGAMVHLSFSADSARFGARRGAASVRAVSPVRILAVETVSAKEIRAEVIAPGDQIGGRLSVHVEAFDGAPAERIGALRVGGQPVSLTADVEPLLNGLCSECHRFGKPSLSTGNVFATTVNIRSTEIPMLDLITPFEPDISYLVWKIRGDPRIVGERMPLNGGPLTDEQIDTVVRWVAQGALPN